MCNRNSIEFEYLISRIELVTQQSSPRIYWISTEPSINVVISSRPLILHSAKVLSPSVVERRVLQVIEIRLGDREYQVS